MLKANVDCSLLEFDQVTAELKAYLEDNCESLAHQIKDEAIRLCPIDDGKMVKTIKVAKNGDDYRVVVRDPKSHLVEFGHVVEDKNGNIVGHAQPKPFLRPAREKVIGELLRAGTKGIDFVNSSGFFGNHWEG
ncbi:HK97 gp10 family phage protein [Maridesulfovibrio ferrireducens]|uniref:HK97 gp10 family phage protein n=1 Tax=Maridesulfovibrio ferrireducens TaxID=246191 RepID=UPI001A1C4470|nr:HK97 gp10 family phage protein [Maridesulfovibrio ferrireducens]MBI9110295.1 HK97 gp10 family phage protein [Maridesulfovibrio ferrireducens]